MSTDNRLTRTNRKIQIVGAICVWFLIYMSPTLGSTLLEVPFGFTGMYEMAPVQSIDALHALLWRPVWSGAGYSYNTRSFGYPDCKTNTDSGPIILVTMFYGMGIGAVGALFQAAAIRRQYGQVKAMTVGRLILLWGSIFTLLSIGSLMLFWVDSWGGCDITPVFQVIWYTGMLYMCVAPVPFLLVLGAFVNARLRRFPDSKPAFLGF